MQANPLKLGRSDEAIEMIESGIALAPDAIDLQIDLGRLHINSNDRVKSAHDAAQALAAAPGRPDIPAALARVMLSGWRLCGGGGHLQASARLAARRRHDAGRLAACQLELGARDAGEATLRAATRGRPEMLGRAVHLLAATSHGRFFFGQRRGKIPRQLTRFWTNWVPGFNSGTVGGNSRAHA